MLKIRLIPIFCLLVTLLSGCSYLLEPAFIRTATPTPPPQSPPTLTQPQLIRSSVFVVQVSAAFGRSASSAPRVDAGSMIEVRLSFEPSEIQVFRNASGADMYSSTLAWKDHPVREMQFCLSLDKMCEPPGKWDPFQPSVGQFLTVDWVGPRTYTIAATFRDANGAVIKSVHSGYGYTNAKDVTRYQNTLTSLVNTATPIAQQPPFVRTALAATQKAFPVTGSVLIEGGRSAAGGTAGSQISLKVQLAASSPAGKVTEMRVQTTGGCNQPTLTAAWEPFTPEKTFTTTLALNWVGFYVAAQFRDDNSHLSPVYCDDISLEGMPARTP